MLLALTFFTGVVSGVYVYFISREPETYPDPSLTEESGYEIVTTMYGGCERIGCSSIRFVDDGSYTYLVSDGSDGYERFEDRVTTGQLETLTELMKETPFDAIADSVFEGSCPIIYDGLAYRFAIHYEGTQYDFDSCSEFLEGVPLFEELIEYFDIMDDTYHTP